MTDTQAAEQGPLAPTVARVLAALIALGADTAARVAAQAGMGYSTVTPKLRTLEELDLAERFKADDGTMQWRPTDTGRSHHERAPATTQTPESATGDTPTAGSADSTAEAGPGHIDPPAARDPAPGSDAVPEETDTPGVPERSAGVDRQAAPVVTGSMHADAAAAGQNTITDEVETAPGGRPAAPDASTADQTAADQHRGPAVTGGDGDGQGETVRRPKGVLTGLVRDVLHTHPDRTFTVGQICEAINTAHEEDPTVARAGRGAVANACFKLAAEHAARLVVDKPATFQAEPATPRHHP